MRNIFPEVARVIRILGSVGILVAFASCASTSTIPADPKVESSASPLTTRIHTYASSELGIFANAYLVETGEGVVAIDATLTVSDAKAFRDRLESLGRPLLAVLLTHGHPDHYNGLTQLISGTSAPIIATAGVDRVIREWDERKEKQWRSVFKDEWPKQRTFPNRIIDTGTSISFGSVRFTVYDLGPGESHHDAYWLAEDGRERVAFVGDITFNGEHAYVSDGHTGNWLKNLDTTQKLHVRKRLADLARQAKLRNPEELAVQLALLIDGAWIAARTFHGSDRSSQNVAAAARALINAHHPRTFRHPSKSR